MRSSRASPSSEAAERRSAQVSSDTSASMLRPAEQRRAIVARHFDEVAIADAESLRRARRDAQRQAAARALVGVEHASRALPRAARASARAARWCLPHPRCRRAAPRRRSPRRLLPKRSRSARRARPLAHRAPAGRRTRRRPRCARSRRRRRAMQTPSPCPAAREGSISSPSRSTVKRFGAPGPAAAHAVGRNHVLVGEHRELRMFRRAPESRAADRGRRDGDPVRPNPRAASCARRAAGNSLPAPRSAGSTRCRLRRNCASCCCRRCAPCRRCRPRETRRTGNRPAASGWRPPIDVMFDAPLRSPTSRSGIAMPSVPTTSDSSARRTSPMAPHAAGGRALTTLPSGAVILSGRCAPALIGPEGSSSALVIVNVAVVAGAGPRFAGPATCGALPVKSAWISSPAIVSLRRSNSGSAESPLLSR